VQSLFGHLIADGVTIDAVEADLSQEEGINKVAQHCRGRQVTH
jgi:hypothetical protein